MNETEIDALVGELLQRPYPMIIRGSPEEGYLAEAPDLPGCFTAGETESEALELLRDAMAGWLAARLQQGLPIPDPAGDAQYSGRILLRISPYLHRRLVEQAQEQGVSLNQWLVTRLAETAPRGPLYGKGGAPPEILANPALHARRVQHE